MPQSETLKRYALGNYQDDEGDHLEQHLVDCSSCEELLAELEQSSDSLVRHLPVASKACDDRASRPPWLEKLKAGPRTWRPGGIVPASDDSDDGWDVNAVLGSYKLTGILGRGGMGIIYAAHHQQLGRDVAIKVVNPSLYSASEAQSRFDREIALLGRFAHPGIVTAIDAGRISGAAYLVMERVDGVDLARLLRHTGPLAIRDACEIGRQIADALAVAHEAGAVHRDLKPSNVMIDREGNVKLLDFGLACSHSPTVNDPSDQTSVGKLIGTLDYMAPEQAEGKSVEASADMFGLGATLFFLLTGRPPRQIDRDAGLLERLRSIASSAAPKVSSLRADIPPELDDQLEQLLNLDPDERPTSAASVSAQLNAIARQTNTTSRLTELLEEVPCDDRQPDAQSISQSLADLLGTAARPVSTKTYDEGMDRTSEPNEARGGPPFRFLFPLLLVGIIFALAWWGVILVLKTEQGTVRIESELPHAEVEFIEGGELVTGVEVESTDRKVDLRVGRYQVRLKDRAADAVIQPVEVLIQSGETTVVHVRRSNSEPSTESAIQVREGFIYKGQNRGVWQRVFEAETEPSAKIVAGTALMQLYPKDDPGLVDAIVELGGTMVDEGWGNEGYEYCDWFLNHMTKVTRHFRPSHWPADTDLANRWNAFVDQAEARLTREVDREALASSLANQIANGTDGDAAFAMHLMFVARAYLVDDPNAAKMIVGTETTNDIERACWFTHLQFIFYPQVNDSERQKFVRTTEALVRAAIAKLGADLHECLASGWLRAVQHYNVPIDRELQAEAALRQLMGDPGDTLNDVFQSRWLRRGEFPYPDEWMKAARDAEPNVWDEWMSVACRWLAEHPEPDADSEHVLDTLNIQLRLREASDSWPVARLIEILKARLERLQTVDVNRFEFQHGLLAFLILAGAELPDESRAALSQSVETYPTSIQKLFKTLTSNVDWNVHREAFEVENGLLQRHPVEVVAMLLRDTESESDRKWSAARFRERLVWLSNFGDGNDSPPPMEPLLLLAIMTELSGQSEELDSRIAAVFDEAHPARIFRRHIEDAVTYPFVISEISKQWLRRMLARSKSDKLTEQVKRLLSEADANAGNDLHLSDHATATESAKPTHALTPRSLDAWQTQLIAEATAKQRLAKAMQAISQFHVYDDTNDEDGLIARETVKVGAAALPILWDNMAFAMKDFYLEQVSNENIPKGTDNIGIEKDWLEFIGKAQSKIVASCGHTTSTRILAEAIQHGTFEESTFAAMIASRQGLAIMSNDEIRPLLIEALDVPVNTSQKSLLLVTVKADILTRTLPQTHALRKEAVDDFTLVGDLLADQLSEINRTHRGAYPNIYFTYQRFAESWLHLAPRIEPDPVVAAKLLLENGWFHWNQNTQYFANLFDSQWKFAPRPYLARNLEKHHEQVQWHVDGWLSAAAEYFDQIPIVRSVDDRERAVFGAGAAVLPLANDTEANRQAADKISNYLLARLRRQYASGEKGDFRPTDDREFLGHLELTTTNNTKPFWHNVTANYLSSF
ncbi:MAG: serine/threonine-protein kinase [Pirellulaceae bacterium]